ncbi:hypothetical protein BDFB_008335 [Asbolus verrucosus]|uniref:Uncharacterized protein n=1 Tax=Asbolus verrucosus TaxID=1661398 RepID=A0A482WDU3_ASBVE|nr:hypothetical protein BDFB_008335 [Asbolus verrucosus]
MAKWENNWTTFIDKMLQMKLLHKDTRFLYVFTGIKHVVIETIKLLSIVQNQKEYLIPVDIHEKAKIVKCPGIEFFTVTVKIISRKKS